MKCPNNCGCGSCNPAVSGGYINGVLTINVGTSSAVIPITQASIETRTPVTDSFSKSSGNTVTISETPVSSLPFDVYRNGILQASDRYSLLNKVVTFVSAFGNSIGGQGAESIIIKYYK